MTDASEREVLIAWLEWSAAEHGWHPQHQALIAMLRADAETIRKLREELDGKVFVGSGNVFRDLELPDPECRQQLADANIELESLREEIDDWRDRFGEPHWTAEYAQQQLEAGIEKIKTETESLRAQVEAMRKALTRIAPYAYHYSACGLITGLGFECSCGLRYAKQLADAALAAQAEQVGERK